MDIDFATERALIFGPTQPAGHHNLQFGEAMLI